MTCRSREENSPEEVDGFQFGEETEIFCQVTVGQDSHIIDNKLFAIITDSVFR